ncbi:MAG TPA: hypothetical protein VK151_16235 [Fluviicola sp.]|nr:hypothetical protein [Fluviicola sp.]
MEKLKIVDDGQLKKIEVTDKYAKGIFRVVGKAVKKNCEILKIDLSGNNDPLELIQRVTKIGDVGILSIKIENEYYQYILKEYADKADIEELIAEFPNESKDALRQAYNLTKMNTLQDFSFLGGPLGNVN